MVTIRSSSQDGAFKAHAEQDPSAATTSPSASDKNASGMTTMGKIAIFLLFPTIVGLLGLYSAYLQLRKEPDRTLDFDNDFMNPFLLALAMCVVVYIQTGGFTSKKMEPLIKWPKVKRVKKSKRKED